jgi:hypothetical protein
LRILPAPDLGLAADHYRSRDLVPANTLPAHGDDLVHGSGTEIMNALNYLVTRHRIGGYLVNAGISGLASMAWPAGPGNARGGVTTGRPAAGSGSRRK